MECDPSSFHVFHHLCWFLLELTVNTAANNFQITTNVIELNVWKDYRGRDIVIYSFILWMIYCEELLYFIIIDFRSFFIVSCLFASVLVYYWSHASSWWYCAVWNVVRSLRCSVCAAWKWRSFHTCAIKRQPHTRQSVPSLRRQTGRWCQSCSCLRRWIVTRHDR